MHPRNTKEVTESKPQKIQEKPGFRVGVTLFATLFGIWLAITLIGFMAADKKQVPSSASTTAESREDTPARIKSDTGQEVRPGNEGHVAVIAPPQEEARPADHAAAQNAHGQEPAPPTAHAAPAAQDAHKPAAHQDASHAPAPQTAHKPASSPATAPPKTYPQVVGWTFVTAAMKPMHHELYNRFWGWRPNDILDVTDNVNNFQLGVLEVTRRTAVKLAEDISRTGSTAAFDPNLEQAMNWFMIRPEKFWFPSAESKYKAGLRELAKYQEKLILKKGNFYNRSDNLIPLLIAYKNLLGSCDENLVKAYESDGTSVSFFKADDYFYYAQGVASAMAEILEAVEHDFHPILQSRNGLDVLHHAIHACRSAEKLDPILILNSDMSGLLANHRANLATYISHARFYVGVLITALST